MQQETGLSIDSVRIIQALVLLFVAADVIVRTIFRIRAAEHSRRWTPPTSAPAGRADVKRLPLRPAPDHRRASSGSSASTWSATWRRNLDAGRPGHLLRAAARPGEDHRRPGRGRHRHRHRVLRAPRSRRSSSGARPRVAQRRACSPPSLLFVPLVIVLALALSTVDRHERDAAAGRVAPPQHPDRARGHGGALVRALRRRQHRHRGDDADVGVHRLPRLRRRSATVRTPGALWLAVGVARAHRRAHRAAPRAAVGHLPRRPDHLGRGDQPARPRPHRVPALRGDRRHRASPPACPTAAIGLPLLSEIPIVGTQLFTNKPIFFSMFVIIARHGAGCCTAPGSGCGCGRSASTRTPPRRVGIDPIKVRYRAVVIGGLIAGLAGAWFSLESQAGFQDNMTNGTGFIALAALIFGRWRPWTAFAGAILFGFTRALGARLQILGVTIGDFSIPSEFLQALPYVVTIIVVAGAVGRADRRPRPTASPTSDPDEHDRLERAARGGRRGLRAGLRPVLRLPGRRGRAWWTTGACSRRATSRTRRTASPSAPSAGSCRRCTPPAAGAWSRWRASTVAASRWCRAAAAASCSTSTAAPSSSSTPAPSPSSSPTPSAPST